MCDNTSNEIKKIQLLLDELNTYNTNNQINDNPTLFNKQIRIFDFLISNKNIGRNNFLNADEFSQYKKFAISEGGLMNNKNRIDIYQKLFCVNNNLNYKGITPYTNITNTYNNLKNKINKNNYISVKNIPCVQLMYNKDKKEFYIEESNQIIDSNIENENKDIIKNDIDRSVINKIVETFTKNNKDYEVKLIKKYFHNFLEIIFQFKNIKYDYYQGFHDFSIFIFLLFLDNPKIGIIILQRIVETHLKDYLDYNNKFNPDVFENVILILKETLRKINVKVFNELEEDNGGAYASLCVSWVICLFAQKFENLNNFYRILDYILFTHPISVFLISSNILIDEWNTFKKSNLNRYTFLEHVTKINFDKINFDFIIGKSESFINLFNSSNLSLTKTIIKINYSNDRYFLENLIDLKINEKLFLNSPLKISNHGGTKILHKHNYEKYIRNKNMENFMKEHLEALVLIPIVLFIFYIIHYN